MLAGRRQARIEDLFELIRALDPTGVRLGTCERTETDALASRLQSLLIERFGVALVVEADEVEAGVISLRHRTCHTDACRAALSGLSPAAQAWVRVQREIAAQQRRLAAAEAAGDWFAVRALADELAAKTSDGERDALLARRDAARGHIRAHWLEDLVVGPEAATDLHDLPTYSSLDQNTPVHGDGQAVVFAEACDDRLFVRVLDLGDPALSRAATIRMPEPQGHVGVHVVGDAILVTVSDHLLRLDLHTLEPQAWHSYAAILGDDFDWVIPLLAPGGRQLWLYHGRTTDRWDVAVVDVERWTRTRSQVVAARVVALRGTPVPLFFAITETHDILLLDDQGTRRWTGPRPGVVRAVATDPAGRGLVVLFVRRRRAAEGGGESLLATVLDTDGHWGPEFDLGVVKSHTLVTAATALAHGCSFIATDPLDEPGSLIALAAVGDGLGELWRTPIGGDAVLLQDEAGQHVILTGDEPTPRALDRWPPQVDAAAALPEVPCDERFPSCAWTSERVGDRVHGCMAVFSTLPDQHAEACFMAAMDRPLDRDGLIALHVCARVCALEAHTWRRLQQEHRDDPVVVMLAAEQLMEAGDFAAAHAQLAPIDRDRAGAPVAQHIAHLLATCHLRLGRARAALRELRRAQALDAGACELGPLVQVVEALVAPLDAAGDPARPGYEFVLRLRRADAALLRGDFESARAELDVTAVWRTRVEQAWARLAAAYLVLERDDAWFLFRKRRVLARFLADQPAGRETPRYLGRLTWPAARIDKVAHAASWRLDGCPEQTVPFRRRPRRRFPLAFLHGFLSFIPLTAVPGGAGPGAVLDDFALQELLRANADDLLVDAAMALTSTVPARLCGLVLDPGLSVAPPFRAAVEQVLGRQPAGRETALLVTVDVVARLLSRWPHLLDAWSDYHTESQSTDSLTMLAIGQHGVCLHRAGLPGKRTRR